MAREPFNREQFASGGRRTRADGQRQLRVAEELRHVLTKIFRQGVCLDPALQDVSIAVTEVRMSPDLRNATAFVMPLAGSNAMEIVDPDPRRRKSLREPRCP